MPDLNDPVAVLKISPARRLFSVGVQGALGMVLVLTAGQLPEPHPAGVFVLVGLGGLSLWMAYAMYRATGRDLVLTREGVFDSSGETVALMEDIAAVESGFFAFKPSNGFLIRLSTKHPRRWVPGLWWRVGRQAGVGGATNGKAARDMAEIIRLLKSDPNAGLPPA